MRKKKGLFKTFLSVLLSAVMVLGGLAGSLGEMPDTALTVHAEEAQTYGDYEYEVNSDNTVTITKYKGSEADVVIPNKINGFPVTGIGYEAFSDCQSLISVVISDGITTIGTNPVLGSIGVGFGAFFGCSNLVSVTIPDSVTSIKEFSFFGCSSLTSIVIPNGITTIERYTFDGCTGLPSVTIPDSVTSIETSAFSYCKSLISITIPDRVTNIEDNVFSGCTSLTAINVNAHNTVYSSVNGILYDKAKKELLVCPAGKKSVIIPDSVSSIGNGAFSLCNHLVSLTIPDSVQNIKNSAFANCQTLETITLPDSMISIEENAFYGCTALQSVIIPDGLVSIEKGVFSSCRSLSTVRIPDSVQRIGDYAFFDCPSLIYATIPAHVKTIGNYAFRYCTNLIFLSIPQSVESIGSLALDHCDNLTIYGEKDSYAEEYAGQKNKSFTALSDFFDYIVSTDQTFVTLTKYKGRNSQVIIPEEINGIKVTKISSGTFYYSSMIKSVVVTSHITDIGAGAFSNCDSLTDITADKNNQRFISENGVLYSKDKTSIICCPPGKEGSFIIPDSVTNIDMYAFSGCRKLTDITIPAVTAGIDDDAFLSCYGLNYFFVDKNNPHYCAKDGVLFNKDKTTLVRYPCAKEGTYTIPDGVITVNEFAFSNCDDITQLIIPDSVKTIRADSFNCCQGLSEIILPDSVNYIGNHAFTMCGNLEKIVLSHHLAEIPRYAFAYCGKLKSVIIPDSVQRIGLYAFLECNGLSDITIPPTVTSISNDTFENCLNLTIQGQKGSYAETYASENNIPFKAVNLEKSILSADIKLSQSVFTYNGTEKKPSVTVMDKTTTLVKGTDYSFRYENNINAGTAKVIVTGKGHYTGSLETTFTINKKSITNGTLTVNPTSYTYDGTEKKPAVTVTLDGKTLTTNDYTVTYRDNTKAGAAKVVVTGKDNYTGSLETTFTIKRKSISNGTLTVNPTSYTYDGNPKTPSVTVTDGDKTLVQDTDYRLTYANNINVGTAYVTVTGIGNYQGAVKKSFVIQPKPKTSIADMTITVNASSTTVYNGKPKQPTVTIKNGNTLLTAGTDYTCTYANNINAGTATVTITGKGDYTGTVTRQFIIEPVSLQKAVVTLNNNSYVFDGKAKRPDTTVVLRDKTLEQDEDYSVLYSSNTNIGTALVTITGIGNYTDTVYAAFVITKPKETFVWDADNWNFINSSRKGYFKNESYRKQINTTYRDVLAKSLTNSEYQTVFVGKNGHPAWLDDTFGGACYGMSSTVLLSKAGFMDFSEYQSGARSLHDLDYPAMHPINYPRLAGNVSSLITYYQMIQVKDVIQQKYRTVPKMKNADVIKTVKELLKSNTLVMIGFKQEDWGGHAVLAYGYDNDAWTLNGKSYNGRIWLYDPNQSMACNENYFLYFNTSDYRWEIPAYAHSGVSSAEGAKFNYVGADINAINCGGYLFHTDQQTYQPAGSQTAFVARIDANQIADRRRVSKVAPDSNGNYMNMAAEEGEIEQDYSFILSGNSKGTAGYNLYDGESAYKVNQFNAAAMDVQIDYAYCDLSVSASAGQSVIFDKKGYISLDSEKSDYTLTMTWDEDYPTDWFTISVSGTGADNVTLTKRKTGYILAADTLKNLKIRANNRIDTATAALTTKYKSVFIYEIDKNTIGLKVDTDNNGTYETKLQTVSILENESVLSSDEIKKGGSVKVTASAVGGTGGYTYAVFYKKASSTKWTSQQDYSENKSVTITPASSGSYDICVKVRDSAGNMEKKYFTLRVLAPLQNDSAISATSVNLGSSLTVRAYAAGGTGNYEYAVFYKKASSTAWTTKQNYSTNQKVTIKPAAAVNYDVCVKVRDSAGTISKKYFTVTVTAALKNTATLSAESIRLGDTLTIKAAATGGTGGYQYAVLCKKASSDTWTTKQNYSTNKTVTFKPAAAVNYTICVKVRDSSGTIARKTFTVKVTK